MSNVLDFSHLRNLILDCIMTLSAGQMRDAFFIFYPTTWGPWFCQHVLAAISELPLYWEVKQYLMSLSQWGWNSNPLRPGTCHTAGSELWEVRQCCAFWRTVYKHHEKAGFFQHLLSPGKGRSAIITLDLHWFNFNPALSLSLSFLLDSSPNAYWINFFISMNTLLIYTFEHLDTAFHVPP